MPSPEYDVLLTLQQPEKDAVVYLAEALLWSYEPR